jgi:DNA-binding LacI/PurR family transcriptional regulator
LLRGSTGAVAILIYDMTRAAMVARLAGAISDLDEHGYGTVVHNTESSAQQDPHVRRLMWEHRAEGAVVVSVNLSKERVAAPASLISALYGRAALCG